MTRDDTRSNRTLLAVPLGLSVLAAACGGGGFLQELQDAQEDDPGEAAGGSAEAVADDGAAPDQGAAAEEPPVVTAELGDADPACAGEADGVLRIGLLPEGGEHAVLAPSVAAGVRLAVAEINEAGSVLGQDVELLPTDGGEGEGDGGESAREAADRHLDAGADVIVGPTASSVTLEVIDTITAACTIQFSPGNSAPELSRYDDDGLYFRTTPSDVLQGRALAELARDEDNETLGLLAREGAYGEQLRRFTRQAFEEAGGEVVADVLYDPGSEDLGAEADEVVAAEPDGIVLIGFGESRRALRALFERGFTPEEKSVYLVDGNIGDDLGEGFEQPGSLVGVKGTLPAAEVTDGFRDSLLTVDPDLTDLLYAPEAYDAVVIAALATLAAGTDDPAEIARHINGVTRDGEPCETFEQCALRLADGQAIDYTGPSGPQELSLVGEPTVASFAVLSYGQDNEIDRDLTEYRFARIQTSETTEADVR